MPQVVLAPSSTTALGALQTIQAGGLAVINKQPYFAGAFVERKITITSGFDRSDVTFTVVGLSNGVVVTELITGPDVDTVESLNYFSQVRSITASNLATNVSFGTGDEAFFLLRPNWQRDSFSVGDYSLTLDNPSGENYTVLGTLALPKDVSLAAYITANVGLFTITASQAAIRYMLPTSINGGATQLSIADAILIHFEDFGAQPSTLNYLSR